MTPLNALSKMNHLKPVRKLNSCEKELIREWAEDYGTVRQRTVRQETTIFKTGALPLNMSRATSVPKNMTFQTRPLEAHVYVDENEQEEDAAEMSTWGLDCEQESEYDEYSEFW